MQAKEKGLSEVNLKAIPGSLDESASEARNYLRIINRTWQELPYLEGFKSSYATLCFAIFDSVNRNYWRPVKLPLDYLLNKCGFCRKVYTDSRNWLVKNQIIHVIPGRNANQMAVFDIGVAVHLWTGTDTGTDTYNPDLDGHKRTGTGTHFKTVNNNKPKTVNIPFDTFWDLYDNKKGREACITLWNKLKDEERQSAIDHIPKYKLATPDKTFRQGPKRYLKEKTFNDEITPAFKSTNKNHSAILVTKEYGEREPI